MHAARWHVGIDGLAQKKRQLMRERFGLRGERGHGKDRTRQAQRGLAQHQRIGGASQAHHRKSPMMIGLQARFKLARSFFKTSFQLPLPKMNAERPPAHAKRGLARRWQ